MDRLVAVVGFTEQSWQILEETENSFIENLLTFSPSKLNDIVFSSDLNRKACLVGIECEVPYSNLRELMPAVTYV